MGVADAQFVLGRAQSLIRKVSPSVPFPEGVSNPKMGAGCSYLSAEAGDQQQGHFYAFSGGWHRAPLHSSDARLAGGGRMQKQGPAWEIAAVSGGSLTSSPKPLTLPSHSITDIYRPRKVTPGPKACWRFQDALVKNFIFNKKQV